MIRMFGPADIEFIDVASLAHPNQFVPAAGAIGLEIDLSMRVGSLHEQYFTGPHLVQDHLGFQDGQGAIQSLGIELHSNLYFLPVFYQLHFLHGQSLQGLNTELYILISIRTGYKDRNYTGHGNLALG